MCFIHMKKEPIGGTAAFYRRLLKEHGTYVGPGRWFERDDTFFRLGYGWPTGEDLEKGLTAISKALRAM
jgi:DNA-binding transcriptional MocR family regulator